MGGFVHSLKIRMAKIRENYTIKYHLYQCIDEYCGTCKPLDCFVAMLLAMTGLSLVIASIATQSSDFLRPIRGLNTKKACEYTGNLP